jgi:hypothetical protein
MRRKLVLIVFCLGLVWSLLALGAYTLIDGAGAALVDWVGGGGLPGEVLGAVLALLKGLGLGFVFLVWLLGMMIVVTLARGAVGAGLTVTTFQQGMRRDGTVWTQDSDPFAGRQQDLPAGSEQDLTLEQKPDGSWGPPTPPDDQRRHD